MASYEVRFRRSAAGELEGISRKADRRRIAERIGSLREDPRPSGCMKLSAQDRYRLRQGAYRILYEIDDDSRVVTVVKIGHRKDIYR